MSFRSWVPDHAGQSVRVEWETWSSSGTARVLLVGFDEAAEQELGGEVLVALLEELEGTSRTGFRQTVDGTVPVKSLGPEIDRLLSGGAGQGDRLAQRPSPEASPG